MKNFMGEVTLQFEKFARLSLETVWGNVILSAAIRESPSAKVANVRLPKTLCLLVIFVNVSCLLYSIVE